VVAQLINTADGSHIWSEKYDRPLTDLFAVQDDIAGKIVGALMPHLGGEQAKLASSDTGDISPALFERFMRARHRYYDKTPQAVAFAHGEFQAITVAAPAYGPAWGWLARTWMASCKCAGGDVEEAVAFARAREAIDTALKLNPDEPLAVLAEAHLLRRKGQLAEALPVFDRAIALDPMLVDAHIGRERLLVGLGRADEAIQGLEKARAIDPLHPEVLWDLAHLLNLQKRTRDAFVAVDQLYAVNPASARGLEGHLYADNNEIGRALFLLEHIFREGGKDLSADWLGRVYLILGQPAHPAVATSSYAAAGLACEGKRDEALALLQRLPVTDDTLDARVTARIALGDLDAARDLLWQKWQGFEKDEFGATRNIEKGVALVALLQQTGRAEDAEETLRALEADFKLASRLHDASFDWLTARLALARGDRQAAIAAFAKLAKDGSVGNRSAGGIDPLLGDLPDDPRMQPVIKRFDANLAAQNAVLERLRASGMSVDAARKEYVAGLPH
jgi:tetratricopeptide (TPR) repeat protein